MVTPPGGPYGGEHQPQPQHDQPQRYNFPSAPSRQWQTPPPPDGPEQYRQHRQQPPPSRPTEQTGPRETGAAGGGGDSSPLVRPYAMTGGRTRPRYQLAIEALVHTTAQPAQLQGQLPEHQRICRLCYEIKSVAEISALLSIPLGVARILVADLAEAGLVAIHQAGGEESAGGQPDVTLLERVLSGLRKL
ncbi:DUF742 domain-containing protein [Streptomyces sp. TRM43335]|uniref:DUF742 domain-containing protein n=1 Tax=Streptomyces taklimakanensis TaxID=2569853 RepID=A0A6G2BFY8_9ACTN|nr:DUF742 domain-containing protein [Streptomyces taklimakanensis]